MVMEEIVENLTKPLTAGEKKTGVIEQSAGPKTFTDTPDNLRRMFMEKRMTDYMPIILPTEERVADMLKGTSHSPDKVVKDLEIAIPLVALLIAFLAVFEGAEDRASINGNYKKLKKASIVNRKNELLLKSLVIMKTKQAEVNLEQVYDMNKALFTVEKLLKRLYQ